MKTESKRRQTNNQKLTSISKGSKLDQTILGKSKGDESSLAGKLSILRKQQGTTSILDNRTGLNSDKSEMNLKEDFLLTRTNVMTDKLIKAYVSNRETDLIDDHIGLDKSKNDLRLFKQVNSLSLGMNDLTLTSPREDNNLYELVEKHYIQNLRKENAELSEQIRTLANQMKETKNTFHKVSGEAYFLKQVNQSQNQIKSENIQRIKILQTEIEKAKKLNRKLKDVLTQEGIDKDNLYRALINYTGQFDKEMAEELALIYQGFNNQYFLAKYKPVDEKEVEELMNKISATKKQIAIKDKELSWFSRFLVHENINLND